MSKEISTKDSLVFVGSRPRLRGQRLTTMLPLNWKDKSGGKIEAVLCR